MATNSTKWLGLPQWAGTDHMLRTEWNEAFADIEKAIRDFTYIIDTYGYDASFVDGDAGELTITVEAKSGAPASAVQTAVFNTQTDGSIIVHMSITIDSETVTSTHTLSDTQAEGAVQHE